MRISNVENAQEQKYKVFFLTLSSVSTVFIVSTTIYLIVNAIFQ